MRTNGSFILGYARNYLTKGHDFKPQARLPREWKLYLIILIISTKTPLLPSVLLHSSCADTEESYFIPHVLTRPWAIYNRTCSLFS